MTTYYLRQKRTDDHAFPVRILLEGLEGGFSQVLGPGRDPYEWIQEHLGRGNAVLYGWKSPFCRDGLALYCRSPADAQAFLDAFPEYVMADGTATVAYNSIWVTNGRRRE